MLRQAAAKHAHAEASKSEERPAMQSTTMLDRPSLGPSVLGISRSAGNAGPMQPAPRAVSKAVKRTSSGLAKAMSKSDGFDEDTPIPTAPTVSQHDFFGENDFDSDLELEIEDLGSKQRLVSPVTVRVTGTASATKAAAREAAIRDAQRTQSMSRDSALGDSIPSPSNDAEIPWSSSPAAHLGPPLRALNRFAYVASENKPDADAQPILAPPPKRRTLPWAKKETETMPTATVTAASSVKPHIAHCQTRHLSTSTATAKSTTTTTNTLSNTTTTTDANTNTAIGHATPAPATYARQLPWEKTSSAIKEQQKGLRELNKARIKTSKGVPDVLAQLGSKPKDKVAPVFLSSEQQHVCDLVLNKNQSVFFTGSAGTGKSVLLREIIARLRVNNSKEPDRVAVTASTGLAACNVGGVTLHSFAGFGLGKEEVPELVKKIRRNGKAKQRWMRTKVLIIDEISMVDADLFDKLETIARNLRRNARPFGGIQLVITGDFFQLPPVPENNRVARFAFDAETWKASVVNTIGLHQVFRQKDPVFANMLNEMREGRLSPSSIQAFAKLSRPLDSAGDLAATELFPTRQEVERANSGRMSKLAGSQQTYDARDGGVSDATSRDRLLSNCMAPKTLMLKKGSQVMLIKNIDETLVNGSVGKVIAFQTPSMYDRYQNGVSGPDDRPEAGALADQSLAESKIQKAAARLSANIIGSSAEMFPLVRFVSENGVTRDLLCEREQWKVELPNGEVQASRSQIPLILAWALSIHKAQGQTLERVKVDLGRVFEKGQAYVALSRATTIAGLQVLRFDAKKVMAHDRVRQFYSNLSRVEAGQSVDDQESRADVKREVKPASRAPTAWDYEAKFLNGEI